MVTEMLRYNKAYLCAITIMGLFVLVQGCDFQNDTERMYELYEETQEFQRGQNPLRGDDDNLTELPSVAMEDLEERNEYWVSVLEEIEQLDREGMNPDDQISYDLFDRQVRKRIKDFEFQDYLIPINHEGGFHTSMAGLDSRVPLDSLHHYEGYITRLNNLPDYFEQQMDHMRTGIETGHVLPEPVMIEEYLETIEPRIGDDPEESGFYEPFEEFPSAIEEDEYERLREEGRQAIEEGVNTAYRNFRDFMVEEYMPNARETIGTTDLPGGEEYYNYLIDYYTTLEMSAEEIHQVGLDEVERIRGEMEQIIEEVEFEGSFNEFLEFLRTDPQFYVDEPEELLKQATYYAKMMDGQLPELFNTLPRQPYGVEPVPAHLAPRYTGGRYSSGGSNSAGNYWVNTYNVETRPLYTLEALTYHEAVPGHHLQIALARELDLPEIRQRGGTTAFVEGWALYAEKLGVDVDLYEDPYSDFGRLTYEMWRACRLVVDTGMHALDWTRDEAVELMTNNTALSSHEINTEVNRYIAVPGQALAYKIGELTILELREEAEEELGDDFDIREFHDAVLLEGPVPLNVLEDQVRRYISEAQS